jgi:hypothetical protein
MVDVIDGDPLSVVEDVPPNDIVLDKDTLVL